jgi:2,3-dihydroxybenzoate-AMP ligase
MTADYIAFHASERPAAIAVVDRGREISYAKFHRDIRAFTRAVREFGLPRGSSVAVACGDFYVHWLLLLGLERLGIATASYQREENEEVAPLLAGVDLVISEVRPESDVGERHHAITEQWLQRVFALDDADVPAVAPGDPGDPLRILRTSGTTGASKRLLLTRRMYEAWVDRWLWSLEITRASRYLVTKPFTVTGIYTLATAVIRSGGTAISGEFATSAGVAGALTTYSISHAVLTPIELKTLLDALPLDFTKPANLTLCTIGAAVVEALREKAMARLASEMVVYYGSNEIPFIAETRSSGSEGPGAIFPWVRAEVVDDRGHPVPPGTAGRVRLKADAMASGYLGDSEASATMFRDGWFYPGDMGILHGPRQLKLLGRGDELLNIGGAKISPTAMEGLVLRHVAVGDVGVCSIPNSQGIEEICVAVAGAHGSDQEVLEQVTRAFRNSHLGGFYVIRMDHIPRNANGKIQRNLLKDAAAASMRGR